MLSGEPFGTEIANFVSMGESERQEFIIEVVSPFYIDFYASWYEVWQRKKLEIVWLTYEELTRDPKSTLSKLGAYFGLNVSPENIDEALEGNRKENNRYNVGKMGRGIDAFTKNQRDRIAIKAKLYSWVDFSRIGL